MSIRTLKMRLLSSILASIAILTTTGATALTFNVIRATTSSGSALDALQLGDLITIDIRMSNPAGVAIYGVGAGIQGWDENVLSFVSGELNVGPYFCTTASCTSGLFNIVTFPADGTTGKFLVAPSDVQNVPGVGNYFPIVQALGFPGRAGTGARDPGLDGVVNGGDAQFRVVFRVNGLGNTTIDIGTNGNPILGNVVVLDGGVAELATNARFTVGYIPEPTAAVLMGLGLAGLGVNFRRK